jgi:hypothetical protein
MISGRGNFKITRIDRYSKGPFPLESNIGSLSSVDQFNYAGKLLEWN